MTVLDDRRCRGVRNKDFLAFADLTKDTVQTLVEQAHFYQRRFNKEGVRDFGELKGQVVVSLFYENSTRTRMSFERATKLLGGDFAYFDIASSSVAKGESLRDTATVLEALGFSAVVVRHYSEGVSHQVAKWLDIPVINAGDGCHEHPSQAIGDLVTLSERFGSLKALDGLKVAFVGDVAHSRVARSVSRAVALFGASSVFVGPPEMLPPFRNMPVVYDLDEVIGEVDVLYMLRVQQERLLERETIDLASYVRRFQLNQIRSAKMRQGGVIMHPGPMNVGVEVDAYVSKSLELLAPAQVRNGVFGRMAILSSLLGGEEVA